MKLDIAYGETVPSLRYLAINIKNKVCDLTKLYRTKILLQWHRDGLGVCGWFSIDACANKNWRFLFSILISNIKPESDIFILKLYSELDCAIH